MSGGGPYLNGAVLCERVLQEVDGVISLIRIFDRWQIASVGTGPEPSEIPRSPAVFSLFVSFRSGSARGRETLLIRVERPDGTTRDMVTLPLLFEGEERGANAVVQLTVTFEMEGLYWFAIVLDGREVTRIPLRVLVLHQQAQPLQNRGL